MPTSRLASAATLTSSRYASMLSALLARAPASASASRGRGTNSRYSSCRSSATRLGSESARARLLYRGARVGQVMRVSRLRASEGKKNAQRDERPRLEEGVV